MAFLTLYTPTYKRPRLLQKNIESLLKQSVDDWEQVIIRDEVGIGVGGMFADVVNHLDKITGDYVYFFQDDDQLFDKNVVRDLRTALLTLHRPPLLMVKNIKNGITYPTRWRERPQLGHVDLGSFVVRADIFKLHAHEFGNEYASDYKFINAIWPMYETRVQWFARVVSKSTVLGLGQSEIEILRRERMATI